MCRTSAASGTSDGGEYGLDDSQQPLLSASAAGMASSPKEHTPDEISLLFISSMFKRCVFLRLVECDLTAKLLFGRLGYINVRYLTIHDVPFTCTLNHGCTCSLTNMNTICFEAALISLGPP